MQLPSAPPSPPAAPRRAPAKLNDAAPTPLPHLRRKASSQSLPQPAPNTVQSIAEPESPLESQPSTWIRTEPNHFGLYKVYPQRPTHDPDEHAMLNDLYCAPKDQINWDNLPLPKEPWYYPFPNASVAHLMKYHIEEENPGSIGGFDRFIQNILQPNDEAESDGVDLRDLPRPFSTKKFLEQLDKNGIEPLEVTDKWISGSVQLKMPCVGHSQKECDAPTFTVTDIHYRPLLDPIREVLQGPLFEKLHTTPFSLRFDPTFDSTSADIVLDDANPPLNEYGLPGLPPGHEEVFGELYTSAAFLEAYKAIPQPPPPQSPEDPVESIIMGIMEWSDATHLAQFGTASLWPGYTFFGNHPKGFRAKPSSNAGFHQAYFATLPDSIRDTYRAHYGCDMSDEVYKHLKRELMHRIWDLLLSEDFIDAYDNGIKIRCWDGIVRLVFPRFFIYGADYPEKILLATIAAAAKAATAVTDIQPTTLPQNPVPPVPPSLHSSATSKPKPKPKPKPKSKAKAKTKAKLKSTGPAIPLANASDNETLIPGLPTPIADHSSDSAMLSANPDGDLPPAAGPSTHESPTTCLRQLTRQVRWLHQGEQVEKPFNLITFKLHSLPDYPDAILRYGTTDSFSTQIVSNLQLDFIQF
ncbi:hypothetical protein MIND_00278100 [Mycena indigotica]|uniref:Uncharacterized protein n=1 Tax=Mycena indigotica TaxID=2126181 RepID=A0A8H6TB58_9AGAR|nr:uncharacterized protein MIND_00278100 [Mycena indigotica]KAF7312640.1 hypothetical protein MIND_00278100 [Mycena indigotica]